MIREVCVENFAPIPEKIAKGAERIELCDNLSTGGTTVSHGVAMRAIDYCRGMGVKVMTMVRPRGGDFIYSQEEIEIMKQDLIHLKHLGTDGVVLGCLTEAGWIDEEAMSILLKLAEGLEVTFHMAFDHIAPDRQFDAIDWLAERGVQRILTHGGPLDTSMEQNLPRLKEYVDYAAGRIIILPGGGITEENVHSIASALQVREVHGTRVAG
ncbi:copper homeostasis protein CutC [Peribacillus sp. SCS-37]|uniref:copper homeostasis protein CutC n=1 Tax=Paraperibacillus esterisolvens TaxID=3115296 RepID=UPI0039061DF3